jgi:hypothetical protein
MTPGPQLEIPGPVNRAARPDRHAVELPARKNHRSAKGGTARCYS